MWGKATKTGFKLDVITPEPKERDTWNSPDLYWILCQAERRHYAKKITQNNLKITQNNEKTGVKLEIITLEPEQLQTVYRQLYSVNSDSKMMKSALWLAACCVMCFRSELWLAGWGWRVLFSLRTFTEEPWWPVILTTTATEVNTRTDKIKLDVKQQLER